MRFAPLSFPLENVSVHTLNTSGFYKAALCQKTRETNNPQVMQYICTYMLRLYVCIFLETEEKVEPKEATKEKNIQPKKKERVPAKRKDPKQPIFSHPWLASTLKNHSNPVLGLDFSPNGKYLASWAEGIVIFFHRIN